MRIYAFRPGRHRWPACFFAAALLVFPLTNHAVVGTFDDGIAFVSDLDIFLVNGATSVQLFDGDQDDNSGNIDTLFDDESANAPVGTPVFPDDMQPIEVLSGFDGFNLNGTWELHVLDNFEPDEGDILITWGLFGTLNDMTPFSILGPQAFNVDTDPATIVPLVVSNLGQIGDLNVGVQIVGAGPISEPATLMLMLSGMIGLWAGFFRDS